MMLYTPPRTRQLNFAVDQLLSIKLANVFVFFCTFFIVTLLPQILGQEVEPGFGPDPLSFPLSFQLL